MIRALNIPEVLDRIFAFNTQSDNAACARVCKDWHDIASNHVWRDITGVKALFQLLAPLIPVHPPANPVQERVELVCRINLRLRSTF